MGMVITQDQLAYCFTGNSSYLNFYRLKGIGYDTDSHMFEMCTYNLFMKICILFKFNRFVWNQLQISNFFLNEMTATPKNSTINYDFDNKKKTKWRVPNW